MKKAINNDVNIYIMTPYLATSIETFLNHMSEEMVKENIDKYGLDPDSSLIGVGEIKLQNRVVNIHSFIDENDKYKVNIPDVIPDLAIAGSTAPIEEVIEFSKGSGQIFARFSMFYGGKSKYTGKLPEETGYSLDFPKNASVVHAALVNETFIDSIKSRNESNIREAIDKLNQI